MQEEELNFLRKCFAEHPFIFAKTMRKSPHWYTLREYWRNDKDFIRVVQLIQKYGKMEKFFGTFFRYLYLDDYKYWVMGASLPKTILINRAKWERFSI